MKTCSNQNMDNVSPQARYYWRHRDKILAKNAKKAKSLKYRKHRTEISKKSYYKRKEEKNARPENQI